MTEYISFKEKGENRRTAFVTDSTTILGTTRVWIIREGSSYIARIGIGTKIGDVENPFLSSFQGGYLEHRGNTEIEALEGLGKKEQEQIPFVRTYLNILKGTMVRDELKDRWLSFDTVRAEARAEIIRELQEEKLNALRDELEDLLTYQEFEELGVTIKEVLSYFDKPVDELEAIIKELKNKKQ